MNRYRLNPKTRVKCRREKEEKQEQQNENDPEIAEAE